MSNFNIINCNRNLMNPAQINQMQMNQMVQQQMIQQQQMMMQQMIQQQQMMKQQQQLANNKYEDVYDYIKEEKKRIIFKRVLDDKYFYVKIPCSLRKNELYFTAEKYKKYRFSQIQLFHNRFLNSNEESIDCIKDNDEIKIIEQLHEIDFSCYDRYLSKHKSEEKIMIIFELSDGKRINLSFTRDTAIKEILKILFSQINTPLHNNYSLFFNGKKLDIYDKSTLKDWTNGDICKIVVCENSSVTGEIIPKGKFLEVNFKVNNKFIFKKKIGTLNIIKDLCNRVILHFQGMPNYQKKIKIKTFKINGINYDENDYKILSFYGIRESFICDIELYTE